jgi:hypothetical protein
MTFSYSLNLEKDSMIYKQLNTIQWSREQAHMCWRSLLWRGSTTNPCEYSILMFADLVLILFNHWSDLIFLS